MKSRAVDGVILVSGGPRDDSLAGDIAGEGTPCVVIGHQPVESDPGVGSVVVGLADGAEQVAGLLVEQGHRRIGFIGTRAGDLVLEQFRAALHRRGVPLAEERVRIAGRAAESGARVMEEMLAEPLPPTAVFARTDALAFGALRAAHRRGVAVPAELSIVGHDDVPFAALVEPPLTTVRVDCLELGKSASERLFSLLADPDLPVAPRVVPTALVVRETVARAPVD